MVAMASAEEMMEDERPVHQGCMAGFLHLFDRPQILSGRRLHHTPRRLTSSSSGSATPSERSMPLDRPAPSSSPDMTPPAAPRPSLQDLKDVGGGASSGAAPSWRLPRLSLDSRAVVDGRGKYRPREIRAPSPAAAPPSPSLNGDERRSPSVVARLMGLDALPHGHGADEDGGGQREQQYQYAAALRRSASERVPRDLPSSLHFRFVDPAFFERPSSPLPQQQQYQRPAPAPVAAEAAAMRRAPADPAASGVLRGGIQRRSRFDAREVFPDPARRAASAGADSAAVAQHGGEIALYGEIERRLRKRGIAEPARDLETLKQILEALQLKGLLHHHAPPPPAPHPAARMASPPPIVVMRPSHRAHPHPQTQQLVTPARRLRVDVDRARRPRSPDPSASPARSPASPARRGGPPSPQRRVSPAQSPKQQPPFRGPKTAEASGARSRIARRAAENAATLFPDEEASTTFSDGGSSSSLSASSRWDFEPPQPAAARGDEPSRAVLERCGKLLSSIQAFTGGDAGAAAADQLLPSPVSVLDAAAFLADEDSPSSSSGSKRVIDFNIVRSPTKTTKPVLTVSDPEDDELALGPWTMAGPNAGDPDYAYVADLVWLFHRKRDPADVYKLAEQRRLGGGGGDDTWRHHRRLLCGAVAEALERQRCACPWDPAACLRGADLVDHVWAEVRRSREPVTAPAAAAAASFELDLNDVTCDAIRRDLAAADGAWASTLQQQRPGAEVAEAVLQIERLVFKDLVADTIRELADADRLMPPRRKLVF